MRRERTSLRSSRRPTVSARSPAVTAARNASASRTLPTLAIALGRELRRALGDQGVRLANEGAPLQAAGEDDLATAAERVRDGSRVGHRQLLAAALTVGDEEGDPFLAVLPDRAADDLAGHVVGAAGARGED